MFGISLNCLFTSEKQCFTEHGEYLAILNEPNRTSTEIETNHMFVFQRKARLKMDVKRTVANIPDDSNQDKVANKDLHYSYAK